MRWKASSQAAVPATVAPRGESVAASSVVFIAAPAGDSSDSGLHRADSDGPPARAPQTPPARPLGGKSLKDQIRELQSMNDGAIEVMQQIARALRTIERDL
jgi:hypothetical protein